MHIKENVIMNIQMVFNEYSSLTTAATDITLSYYT